MKSTLNPLDVPWLDAQHFENRRNFPPEELDKYTGQYVAWSWDGSRILASAEDRDPLWEKLVAMGVDPRAIASNFPGNAGVSLPGSQYPRPL